MNNEIKINVPEGMEIDKENSTFECIKFKPIKKELPETWEKFCKNNKLKSNESFIENDSTIKELGDYPYGNTKRDCYKDANVFPSKEYAKAMLALCKLIQLRDCYNDGWKPDWSDTSKKHCIFYNKGNVELFVRNSWSCILVFKSRELRNEFYNNFKDLIEQAKLLL